MNMGRCCSHPGQHCACAGDAVRLVVPPLSKYQVEVFEPMGSSGSYFTLAGHVRPADSSDRIFESHSDPLHLQRLYSHNKSEMAMNSGSS